MDINELTIGQIKDLQSILQINKSRDNCTPFKIGQKWLFRTVTHIDTGEITEVNGKFVTLKNAAWIGDTGRYSDALRSSDFNEVEPYPNGCVVNTDSLVDCTPLNDLPINQI